MEQNFKNNILTKRTIHDRIRRRAFLLPKAKGQADVNSNHRRRTHGSSLCHADPEAFGLHGHPRRQRRGRCTARTGDGFQAHPV